MKELHRAVSELFVTHLVKLMLQRSMSISSTHLNVTLLHPPSLFPFLIPPTQSFPRFISDSQLLLQPAYLLITLTQRIRHCELPSLGYGLGLVKVLKVISNRGELFFQRDYVGATGGLS